MILSETFGSLGRDVPRDGRTGLVCFRFALSISMNRDPASNFSNLSAYIVCGGVTVVTFVRGEVTYQDLSRPCEQRYPRQRGRVH